MVVTVIKKNESVIFGGKIYTHGQSFETDDAIGESLIERGFVENAESAKNDNEADLQKASYTELKKMAASMGLPANGKKDDLITRIESAEAETSDAEEEIGTEELPNTAMPE